MFTGRYAINPVNESRIPIWVADYVLMDYGTGAIMAVPAHDERDFAFAQRFDLPVVQVVAPADGEAEAGAAYVAHSERRGARQLGRSSRASPRPEAKRAIVEWLAELGRGRPAVNYRLRDWLLSRQRYWGCPIPVVHCDATAASCPVPEDDLPVLLPEIEDYLPKGRSPLAAAEEWVQHDVPVLRRRRRGARPTRWTRSSTRPGTSSATPTRATTRRRSTRASSTTGCRSTSTSAGSSTRSCT